MGESRSILLILLFQIFLGFSEENSFSRGGELSSYEYLSPKPFTFDHNRETIIIIRFGEKISTFLLRDEFIEVTGTISGRHTGRFTFSKDPLTLIFTPDIFFSYNEKVTVHFEGGIRTQSGRILPPFDFWFSIRQESHSDLYSCQPDEQGKSDRLSENNSNFKSKNSSQLSFLDYNFPEITFSSHPTPGNILTTLIKNSTSYLYVFDNKAIPALARIMPHSISNLKPHPTGIITYYDSFIKGFIALDPSLTAVDTFKMKNGYRTDAHEICLLENGHIFMFSYDPQIVDMSNVVTGGNPFATVTGLVIQEMDENNNLLFQWRSWDYFNISDSYSDLLSSVIDYVHGNSLDPDTDTTLIISSRNMNEITKISRVTGNIIWRLGGKNNEFIFENDPRQFAGQHSAEKQNNGNLTLFDNGVGLDPLYSRGIEYELDEINKKVKLVHEYRHAPDVYANVSGNLQRLDNGNTFIFFGPALDHSEQFISEYDQTGNPVFEARFGMNIYPAYRAYRSSWEPKLFTLSTDSINIKSVVQNTTLYRTLKITNNSNSKISITSAYHKNIGFYVKDLPVAIEAGSDATFTVAFPSYEAGKTADTIIFCQETDSMLVTRSLFVSINNTLPTGIENLFQTDFKVSPNPGKGEYYIKLENEGKFSLDVFDLSGKKIWSGSSEGIETYHIDLTNESDGMYFLYIIDVNKGTKRTFKLIKKK